MPKQNILVVSGGVSGEHDVLLKTGAMVADALDGDRYDVCTAIIDRAMAWRFGGDESALSTLDALQRIQRDGIDVVFNALHGKFGEDGQLQTLLDTAGVRYTGSGACASMTAMNKAVANAVFAQGGFSVPAFRVVRENEKDGAIDGTIPVVVKPVSGGSSVATTIIRENARLDDALRAVFAQGDDALVQTYVEGREVTCGVLENEHGDPVALLPTEIVPKSSTFFDYTAKYTEGGSEEITPARFTDSETHMLQELAVRAHRILGCRGYSRSDFILANGTFFVLETNTLPGLTSASLFPQEAAAAGIAFSDLLDKLIACAQRK